MAEVKVLKPLCKVCQRRVADDSGLCEWCWRELTGLDVEHREDRRRL